jgi:hypothetical protein
MELHISRTLRDKLNLDELLFSYTGNVVFGNVAGSRHLAQRLNELRKADPEGVTVHAGALFAIGLIDELNHALVARYRKYLDPEVLSDAVGWFAAQATPAKMEQLLLTFTEQFPNVAVYRGELTAAEWLAGSTEGFPNREAALEELMLLWLSNINPAFAPFRDLFEDTGLQRETIYKQVTAAMPNYFATRPQIDPEVGSLLDALCAPFLASPDSLTGQLEFIREQWPEFLGQDLRRVLLAVDTLREEDIAIWMRFHPPGPNRYAHGAPGFGGEGFVGDEFVGYNEDFLRGEGGAAGSDAEFVVGPDGVRHKRYAADYQAPLNEYEAFTQDQAWMPNVVLIAKSTYVWLEQLSKKYQRHIHRLDQIPDEEMTLLASRGITGLWLIGLWERSTASQTIKRLRGDADAVASAYSLKDYGIAGDLGGSQGYEVLRDRAAAAGIRLASDMVPNHVGIDSTWVIEHPDWFLFRWDCPFPVYRFEGPDLSTDGRVEIKIEDHYFDQTDAAVVFRLRHYHDQTTRYVYHGNDGTTFAWNDTAQLDYSKAYVREYVIQTILHVARLFPIIRFDAAMVLAKRHVQRLWFPLPGAGGSIPSRAEDAITQEEFDALMPHEFWREVVDRVAVEVPGTLLLAEAFWLLEGYFVRTLGMHRVYNSAFMNMLRDEENAKYRSYLKKTIEFDPDILKRYVSFMSNPDERTAIDQFGSGDKYFGVCTLLATLPGLPMFGHGQVEGYTERYGMEFKKARLDEYPNDGLIARHQHEIAPLLKNRKLFAESENFLLYDFWTDGGSVDENVFAYSNRLGDQRAVILYNNTIGSTRGTIHGSADSMDKGSGTMRQRSLADGLGIWDRPGLVFAYRDTARGLEYLRRAGDIQNQGLTVELRGYQYVVLLDWRELQSTTHQPWDRLCDALQGEGVYSVDDALSKLRLRPLHETLRQAIGSASIRMFVELSQVVETPDEPVVTGASLVTLSGDLPKDLKPIADDDTVVMKAADEVKAAETPVLKTTTAALTAIVGGVSAKQALVVPPASPVARAVLDPRLTPFLEKCQRFFQSVSESDEGSLRTAGTSADVVVSPQKIYAERCEVRSGAATRLISLQQGLSKESKNAARAVLPTAGSAQTNLWAPVLAWIALNSLPGGYDEAAVFENLQLKAALAESFLSLGVEGENAWRAAARVRVLLVQRDLPVQERVRAAEFWSDPDVRWIAGYSESGGKTYLNKERFEELLVWLYLPELLEIGDERTGVEKAVSAIEAGIAADFAAMRGAGYDLNRYLAAWDVEEPAGVSSSRTIS